MVVAVVCELVHSIVSHARCVQGSVQHTVLGFLCSGCVVDLSSAVFLYIDFAPTWHVSRKLHIAAGSCSCACAAYQGLGGDHMFCKLQKRLISVNCCCSKLHHLCAEAGAAWQSWRCSAWFALGQLLQRLVCT